MQFLPEPNSNSNWNPLSSRIELELIPLAPCPEPELQFELEPNSYSSSTPPVAHSGGVRRFAHVRDSSVWAVPNSCTFWKHVFGPI